LRDLHSNLLFFSGTLFDGARNYREKGTRDVTTKGWLTKIALDASWRFRNLNVLLVVFFSVPIILLYIFVPSTFEVSWKGRVPYMIFIWLVVLEIFLSRNKLAKLDINAEPNQAITSFILGLTALFIPTAFTLWQFMGGGRDLVTSLGRLVMAPCPAADWPLAFESMVFACSFILSVWLLQNRDGLRRFKVSLFFIGAVATFFMVDTFFHFGTVWLLQLFVPPIASTAAFFLNILGYSTTATPYADGYLLLLRRPGGHNMNLLVYWPCAGVHSLIIYTFVILLFFKNTEISSRRKIVYVIVGAVGTFMVNILRIVSIGIIGGNTGPEASRLFHEYYGELFFVFWIVVYLVAVFLYESRHKARARCGC
jgi:thaumarchaeosortase